MPRRAAYRRETNETDIEVSLSLDGTGSSQVATGIGFFDHMLTAFAKHGLFDLGLECRGDLEVDGHHTVEDVGICLGAAWAKALGAGEGMTRFGTAYVPMDEALVRVCVDASGRPFLDFYWESLEERVGQFDTALLEEFLRAFSVHGRITLHVDVLKGRSSHHVIEAVFKGLGRALRQACGQDPRIEGVMSTKGALDSGKDEPK